MMKAGFTVIERPAPQPLTESGPRRLWSVWFIWLVWFTQTNEINQTNKSNPMGFTFHEARAHL
jgi:hypothetical protein